jgi:hypothetical protein
MACSASLGLMGKDYYAHLHVPIVPLLTKVTKTIGFMGFVSN